MKKTIKKKLIIYKAEEKAKEEIAEILQERGNPFFADDLLEFMSILAQEGSSEAYMFVNNFSDIRLVNTIKSSGNNIDIYLIVPPELLDIIRVLREQDVAILQSITDLGKNRSN